MKQSPIFQVLSIRPFLFLWIAELFSQISMNMVNFILIILAFKLANSNTAVSGIVLSFTIPAVLFGVVAGIYVDRWNKKSVLLFVNIIRAVLLCALAVLHSNLFSVYALSFVIAIVTQFFIPAETPMIPLVVPKKLLHPANALFGMGVFGSILIAYVLSGYFYILFGATNVFIVLAIFFVISAFFITLIKGDTAKKVEEVKDLPTDLTIMREFRNALSLVVKTKKISHAIFLLTMSQLLVLVIGVVAPGYAKHVLGIEAEEFPHLFVAPAALGTVIGALLIGNASSKFGKEKITTIGVFLSGLVMLLLPFGSKVASKGFVQMINGFITPYVDIKILHVMMLLAVVLGIANAFVFVPSNTVLQEETSEGARGKAYGALNSLIGVVSLLPIIIVGGLADLVGVGTVLVWIGVVILLVGLYRLLF